MKREQSKFKSIAVSLVGLFLAAGFATPATAQKAIELSDEQVENIVRRSYQYVAMFNVIQKFALDPGPGFPVTKRRLSRNNASLRQTDEGEGNSQNALNSI